MLESYLTVSTPSRIEITEKKSRFIAFCRPLANEEEAAGFVVEIRKAFPEASHHVYAWILGLDRHLQRYSDDGEPQGTAGMPVLDVLRHRGIVQAGIVVVRYFGGTLLGSGGLARAYSQAATLSLEAAAPVTMQLCEIYRIVTGYESLDRIKRQMTLAGAALVDNTFGQDVELVAAVAHGQGNALIENCADASGGRALVEPAGLSYKPLPPPDPPPSGLRA